MSKYIKLHNAYCGYGKKVILPDVSIEIREGDIYLIEGENGAGKTTLGLSLLGLLRLIKGERENLFKTISYVPQKNKLDSQYPLKLQTIVAMGQPAYSQFNFVQAFKNRKKNKEILDTELKRMGLYEKRNLRFNEASGGELQRALVARALITKPDLVLLDEPFANIDKKGRIDLKEILLQENHEHNTTLIVIDHHNNIDFFTKKIVVAEGGVEIYEPH